LTLDGCSGTDRVVPYVPLWVKSSHSFLEGASHPEELVDQAHAHHLPAIALTDRDGLYGAVKAHVRAKELREPEGGPSPRPIVGAEVTLADPGSAPPQEARTVEGSWGEGTGAGAMRAWRPRKNEPPVHGHARTRVVLLAEDREGYGRLTRLLTVGHGRAAEKGASRVSLDEIRAARDGLVALAPTADVLRALADSHAGRLYALCARQLSPEDAENERELRAEARRLGIETVAAVEVLYHVRTRQPLQDVLSCVRFHRTIETAGRLLRPNAEHELLSAEAFSDRFRDDPESVRRTLAVAERCTFGLDGRSPSPRGARSGSTRSATATRPSACRWARPKGAGCAR
jgi:error-prone DNA polymerase